MFSPIAHRGTDCLYMYGQYNTYLIIEKGLNSSIVWFYLRMKVLLNPAAKRLRLSKYSLGYVIRETVAYHSDYAASLNCTCQDIKGGVVYETRLT